MLAMVIVRRRLSEYHHNMVQRLGHSPPVTTTHPPELILDLPSPSVSVAPLLCSPSCNEGLALSARTPA